MKSVKARIVESTIRPGLLSIRSVDGSEKGLKRLLAETFKAGDVVEIRLVEPMIARALIAEADKKESGRKEPRCPQCHGPLLEIRYPSDSCLNRDQWASQRAGDWLCEKCPDNDRANNKKCYWWDREILLVAADKED